MELYNGQKVEVYVVPLKGYYYCTNGEIRFFDAMRTDVFSDGSSYMYGVSVDDEVPCLGSDEYYEWVEERRGGTCGYLSRFVLEHLNKDWTDTLDLEDKSDYERIKGVVRHFEINGVCVHEDVYEYLDELKLTWKSPIRCVETGEEFESVQDCCNLTGIPYMTIYNCVKNKNAHKKTGWHFERIKKKEK